MSATMALMKDGVLYVVEMVYQMHIIAENAHSRYINIISIHLSALFVFV
jgi:hypothetical protein